MEYMCQIFHVTCPVLLSSEGQSGVLLSSTKSPHRPYPNHVYLYAILLCLVGFSMRSAARKAGYLFGIASFSHCTISRCLNRFAGMDETLAQWCPEDVFSHHVAKVDLPHLKHSVQIILPHGPGSVALRIPHVFQEVKRNVCNHLYRILLPILEQPELGNQIVFSFWKRFGKMLL